MANTWKFKIVSDVDGDEPQEIVLRGTTNPRVARHHADLIANAQRQAVIAEWGEEYAPKLTVTDFQAVGDDDSPVGHFKPAGVKPIDLNKFVTDPRVAETAKAGKIPPRTQLPIPIPKK